MTEGGSASSGCGVAVGFCIGTLLGTGPRIQTEVQRMKFRLLHVHGDIELITSGGGTKVSVIETTANQLR